MFFRVQYMEKKKRVKDKICTAMTLQLIVKREIASEECLFKTWQDGRKRKSKKNVNIYLNYCTTVLLK